VGRGPKVAADQALATIGRALGQLREGCRRDVEADQVEAALDQGQVVVAVAAADVEAVGAEEAVLGGDSEDVGDEGQRRLVAVAAGGVLDVPSPRGHLTWISSPRDPRIVATGADGGRRRSR
jgi:hypothetical protein